MKTLRTANSRLAFVCVALGALLLGREGRGQALDSMIPEMKPVGSDETVEEPRKSYTTKAAFSWPASRRFSEHVIEEYQPKLLELLRKASPEVSDSRTWTAIGARLGESWLESRQHGKTGERPADQDEWDKQHKAFLLGIVNDGSRVVDWRSIRATRAKDLQKSADDAPSRLAEIRKNMAVVDPLFAEVKRYSGEGGATWNKEKLEAARRAHAALEESFSLAVSTYGAINVAWSYARVENSQKPSMDVYPTEKAALKRWRSAVGDFPKVQKIYTEPLTQWAKLAESGLDAEVKAWENLQKAFAPVTSGELTRGSPYAICSTDKAPQECLRLFTDKLAGLLIGQGKVVEGAAAKQKEEADASAKERARVLELLRVTDDRKEYRLIEAVERAQTDTERSQAEKELAEYRKAVKAADAESDKIRETHKARRKSLGLPPEDWS